MEQILEKAKELGQLMHQFEATRKMTEAEALINGNVELQQKLGVFNEKREKMFELMNNGVEDKEQIDPLNEEIKALYDEIMADEAMAAFNAAKEEFDQMFNQVNTVLSACIAGQDPDGGCTGCCGTCGGCH